MVWKCSNQNVIIHEQPLIVLVCLKLTKRPVSCEHVCEVWDNIERCVHDVSYREIDYEVICNRAHPSIGHHDPYHWRETDD